MRNNKVPASTYRLQLHKGFTFDDAAAIAQYLYDLGISHVYSSPYLQAAPGSMHGYDVVDHRASTKSSAAPRRTSASRRTWAKTASARSSTSSPTTWPSAGRTAIWWDVLENGAASRYASLLRHRLAPAGRAPPRQGPRPHPRRPVRPRARGRRHQGRAAAAATSWSKPPARPSPSPPHPCRPSSPRPRSTRSSDTLSFLAASFGRLPAPSYEDRRTVLARHRDKIVIASLLDRLCAEEDAVCEAIDRAVDELNADHDALDDFLNQQNYRLAYWKTADQQLGYRRFFDVNTLIGLRMERATSSKRPTRSSSTGSSAASSMASASIIPTACATPSNTSSACAKPRPTPGSSAKRSSAPASSCARILAHRRHQRLRLPQRRRWACWCVRKAWPSSRTVYGDFTGAAHAVSRPSPTTRRSPSPQEALGSDVNRLTTLFVDICENHRNQRDYTRAEVRRAIREIAACFAIYRTYVVPQQGARYNEITAEDRRFISQAIECASDKRPEIDAGLFDFFEQVLTLKINGRAGGRVRAALPAVHLARHGQGRRRHGLLLLQSADRDVRGRRRPAAATASRVDDFHAYQQKMQAHASRAP